jgi:hypothetical protein
MYRSGVLNKNWGYEERRKHKQEVLLHHANSIGSTNSVAIFCVQRIFRYLQIIGR